jgi:tetratricopeptide (TPR) repeat protein
MKKIPKKQIGNSGPLWWIIGGAVAVTLYFNSQLQDPFNSPKMWILMICAAWLVGHIVNELKNRLNSKVFKQFFWIVLLFIFANIFAFFKTDIKIIGLIGENFRRNGFLTYLSLSILTIAAAIFVRNDGIKRIHNLAFFTLLLTTTYGQMQINGIDFVSWANNYNAIISTLGNPNFASAILAILSVIVYGSILNTDYLKTYRMAAGLLVIISFWTIYLSNSIQGLVAGALGFWILTTIKLNQKKKILGKSSLIIGLTSFIFAILGILQIGPLQAVLYKSSVTVRGYYWDAGIEMFKANFISGVGLDRYGSYFKEYRDVNYSLNYGFEITSTNAHNVPIQLFATSGIFVGIFYLAIFMFTMVTTIKLLRESTGTNQIKYASIFAAWLTYHAQSIISIDNIGLSVWGWIFTGSLIGLATGQNEGLTKSKPLRNNSIKLKQPIISGIATALALTLIVPLYKSEVNVRKALVVFRPGQSEYSQILKEFSDQVLASNFSDPVYKIQAATYLIDAGYTDYGMSELEKIHKSDPRDLPTLEFLAMANKNLGRIDQSISYRKEIYKYDKWNARNLLALGNLYKAQGDKINMAFVLGQIKSFASNDPIYQTAVAELS